MYLDKWESQVRKGLLEFILLLTIAKKENYGFELISEIKRKSSLDISEGTIYPLLNRMEREALIKSSWRQEGSAVPRKYYRLTDLGRSTERAMREHWLELGSSIEKLMT